LSSVVIRTQGFRQHRNGVGPGTYRRLALRRLIRMLAWDARRRTPPRITLPALCIMSIVYDDTDPDGTRAKARR
jgi:hypothetical protein